MEKKYLVKRVLSTVVDFDMHNLFEPRDYADNLEDAASGGHEVQPQKTLRERQYSPSPLVLVPKYTGDFLDKLKNDPVHGKPMEAANPENLWDFSMPSEMLKHQEKPHPRNLVDDFYSINGPGPSDQGDGNRDLNEYWDDRGWDESDAPEMSEDKVQRMQNFKDMKKRVAFSFLDGQHSCDCASGPLARNVVGSFLLRAMPVELVLGHEENIKTAVMLEDFKDCRITTKAKGTRLPDSSGVTAVKAKAEPREARWTFTTYSADTPHPYTTTFQFIPHSNVKDLNKLHVRVSCTCPSWLFWGAQFNAAMGHYLYGGVRPKFAQPKIRDPKMQFMCCKHVLKCIPLLEKFTMTKVVDKSVRKRIDKEPRFKIEKTEPEKLRIPPKLIKVGQRPKLKEMVRKWDDLPHQTKRSFIMKLEDPEEVTYFAYRFPESSHYVADRLLQLSKVPVLEKEAKELMPDVINIEKSQPVEATLDPSLKRFEGDALLNETLDGLEEASRAERKRVLLNESDPDRLAFMAFNMRNDHEFLSKLLTRLDDIRLSDADQKVKDRALYWMREIF